MSTGQIGLPPMASIQTAMYSTKLNPVMANNSHMKKLLPRNTIEIRV